MSADEDVDEARFGLGDNGKQKAALHAAATIEKVQQRAHQQDILLVGHKSKFCVVTLLSAH